MKRISTILFGALVFSCVGLWAQDGRLQRAPEHTPDQQAADKAATDKAATDKTAAEKTAEKPAADKLADKPATQRVTARSVGTVPAATAPAAKPVKSATAAGKTPAQPKLINGIPEGATQISSYVWSWTDPEGKEWLYQRNPFGITRTRREEINERAAVAAASAGSAASAEWKVNDHGDTVEFEQPSPFGTRKWTKKKTELNADEQAVWDRLKKKD